MSQSIVGVIISNPPQPIKAVFVPRLVQTAPNFALNGSTSSVSLVAGSNVTFQSNLSTITINAAAGGGTNFTLNASTGSVSLVAGNNITLNSNLSTITVAGRDGFSLNGSSSSVSIVAGALIAISSNLSSMTIAVITNGTGSGAFSTITGTMAGNTLGAASTTVTIGSNFSLSGAGVVSVGASGNTITISAPSVAAGGTQSFSGGGTSVTGSAISIALSGGNNISLASASGAGSLTLTFNASSNALNNVSLLNGSSGAMSVSAGAGIGIGQANSTITVSASVQTSSVTASVAGNTLSTASVTGAYSNSLVISAMGIISGAMSTSGNTLILSATAPTPVNFSTISGSITGNSAGTGTFTIGTGLNISLTGGLSGTASGSSITLSGATGGAAGVQSLSAGANSVTGTAVSLAIAAGNNITLNTATAAGALTVSVTGNAASTLVGGSGISLTSGGSSITINATANNVSLIQNMDLRNAAGTVVSKGGTVTGTAGFGSSLFLSRITIPAGMKITEVDVAMSIGFNATNGGAGTMSRSLVLYSFGNATLLATVASVSGSSVWSSGTSTTAGAVSLTQFQGGWSTPLIQPFTFASTSISAGEYVVGQLFNFAQATSTWTVAFYGEQDPVTATVSTFATAAGSGVTGTVAGSLVTGTVAGSVITALTQNATNNVSWFVSRATSGTTSVASATSSFTFLEAPFVGSIGTAAGSGITGLAAAGSAITGVTAGSIITASGSATVAQLSIPNFGYIGTGSTTSGLPPYFQAGIMSTGAVPVAITVTSNALTITGSVAFQQPWFALVGV